MRHAQCPFCRIVRGEERAKILLATDRCIVFADRKPQSKVHYVVVTKKHASDLTDLAPFELKELVSTAVQAADRLRLPGYRILFNVRAEGGQRVMHAHAHLLARE